MADLSKIMLPDGTSYDIRDRGAIPLIIGTQTAATSRWKGVADTLSSLENGQTIRYFLPFNYSSSDYLSYKPIGGSASNGEGLELTLADGTSTGSLPVFLQGVGRVTSHFSQGSVVILTYIENAKIDAQTATGWWVHGQYWTYNYRAYNLYSYYGNYIANSAIYRYQLLFEVDENTLTPMNNVNNSTATTKTLLTDQEFDPLGRIYYYNTTTTIAAQASPNAGTLDFANYAINLGYSFNTGTSLIAHKPIYLKVILQSNRKCKIASSSPIVQALPASADGAYYILLGRSYNTSSISLFPYHPVYYHDGTSIRIYTGEREATASQSGLMTSAMVTKLNGITESADAVSVSRNLTSGTKIGTITINGTGTDLYCETNTDHITSATTSGSGNAVTAITADANGALTVTKGTTFLTSHQDISGKKNTQSAVNSPTASGTDVAFIDTISQNAQGVITPTKKTVRTFSAATASAAGSTGLVPAPAAGNQGKFLRGDSTWQTVVTDVSGKADKSATVSTVAYDTTNKKITKTINGTTTDVVTTSKLKTDMELDNVGNFKAVSTVALQGLTNTEKLNSRMNINASVNSFPYIDPIESKTYTNVIATANDNQGAGFFFLKIRGDTYHCRWRIKVRLRVTVPGQEFYNTDSVMELWGYANTYSGFVIQNHILSTSYRPFYNHSCFFISEKGYDNNCGNWIGFNLAKSTNSTNTSYKRTVICDLLEYENCSYEMVNALYTPDNIPNRENHTNWYTSTNTSFTNFDAYSQGIKMSGDNNTTSISNLYYVNGNYIADSAIFRYQLLFKADENVLTPMNNISNTVSTSKPLLVDKEFDPFSEIYFYNSTTTIAANAAVPAGSLFYAISSFDLRYSFNAGSTLTAHKPVYLQVIMLPNGKCKISGNSPIVQSLPTTADGYYYILLGHSYSTYQMSLFNYHPIYYYDGNTIQQYNGGVPTLTVNIGTVNSFPITKNVPFVTNDMVVIKHIFGTPSSIIGDVTVTTANGQVTLNGSINGSTTIDLILAKTSAINAT